MLRQRLMRSCLRRYWGLFGARLAGTVGPLRPALQKCYPAGPPGWEIVSRHDIGQRLAAGRDRFGVVARPRRISASVREQGNVWFLPSLEAALAEAEASAGETAAGLRRRLPFLVP